MKCLRNFFTELRPGSPLRACLREAEASLRRRQVGRDDTLFIVRGTRHFFLACLATYKLATGNRPSEFDCYVPESR